MPFWLGLVTGSLNRLDRVHYLAIWHRQNYPGIRQWLQFPLRQGRFFGAVPTTWKSFPLMASHQRSFYSPFLPRNKKINYLAFKSTSI